MFCFVDENVGVSIWVYNFYLSLSLRMLIETNMWQANLHKRLLLYMRRSGCSMVLASSFYTNPHSVSDVVNITQTAFTSMEFSWYSHKLGQHGRRVNDKNCCFKWNFKIWISGLQASQLALVVLWQSMWQTTQSKCGAVAENVADYSTHL